MGNEIDLELRFSAEEQYITGGATLKQIAHRTGISERQLKRWSSKEGWLEKRKEYRRSFRGIRVNTVELRRRFIEKALNSLSPGDVYAVSALARLALLAVESADSAAAALPANHDFDQTIAPSTDSVEALKSVVENRLQRMLLQPGSVNLAAVREIQHCLELIQEMDSRAASEVDQKKKKQLEPEAIQRIRKLCGICSVE